MKLARLTRLSRAVHLLLHPSELVRRVNGLRLERKISNAAKTPFFMQSQMDINQKSNWYAKEFVNQTGGYLVAGDSINRVVETLKPWDIVRRDMIILLLRSIVVRKVIGNLAELGVYKGLPALEAMACGIPVLCSNVASLPEVVGDAGRQVDPYNVEEIAQALETLLTDGNLRAVCIRKGLARSREYTWTAAAARVLDVYREIVR